MSVEGIGPRVAGLIGAERPAGRSVSRSSHRDDDGDDARTSVSDLRPLLSQQPPAPAARRERVAALRAAVEQGTYQVPVDILAKKLIGDGE